MCTHSTWTFRLFDFHFHSLFLYMLNQDLFVVAVQHFLLQWELQ